MPSITRDQFLAPAAVPVEKVLLPELGDGAYVNVHGMTAKERGVFERQFQTKAGKTNQRRTQEVRERLIVACCRDDNGQPIFTDDDVEVIGNQQAAMCERIVNVAMTICGMRDADIEDLAKN